MSLKRFKSLVKTSRPEKDSSTIAVDEIDSPQPREQAFLQFPAEVRRRIYEHVFSRTAVEHLESLHYGPHVNSASGLVLTCRQIRSETSELYHKDNVVSLWPQCRHDAEPYDKAAFKEKPVLRSWKQSPHGVTLKRKPESIEQLALLISLTRETRTGCENFIESEIMRKAHLNIKDLYIRLCICGSLRWLHENPENVMAFCIALETFAHNFSTVERIHILYCGQQWPVWIQALGDVQFPEIALARHEVRMSSGANWSIRRVDAKKRTWGPSISRDPSQIQPPVGMEPVLDEDTCRLRTVMTWNYTAAHPGQNTQQVPWEERSVEINYYDSWTLLEERCVRNKPPKTKPRLAAIAPSRLVARPSSMARIASAIRVSVEGAPLGPTWGLHKYIPETRASTAMDRGSHWRRY